MNRDVAQDVLNAARGRLPKDGTEAKYLLRVWLSSHAHHDGWTEDRHGNFHEPTVPGGHEHRWHFARQVIQKQFKHSADLGGRWANTSSRTFIAAALNVIYVIYNAATELGDAAMVELANAKTTKRRNTRERSRDLKSQKEMRYAARIIAAKRAAWERRDDMIEIVRLATQAEAALGTTQADELDSRRAKMQADFHALVEVYYDWALEVGLTSDAVADRHFASLDKPPVAMALATQSGFGYQWDVRSPLYVGANANQDYTVLIQKPERGISVNVVIGAIRGGNLIMSPNGHVSLSRLLEGNARGDGLLVGRIRGRPGIDILEATIDRFMIIGSELEPGSTATVNVARRLHSIWQALLTGYGIPRAAWLRDSEWAHYSASSDTRLAAAALLAHGDVVIDDATHQFIKP